ncbi:acetyl-CoA acetyltransferase [Mesorhizobium sp.]|uniref:acetyl-CoA acetyltransferase n=1 Tax=Mesorhizobium sp. TaxID=1871066 RepID=UPI000FE2BB7C|nr:acetyl-CoA acetyltransferase [Mesorhizobium sp.]RWN94622.1 MAG: thiolase [Mesorhizobium sp.]RWO75377.1 MAG: thiolase [Mesorhizobium sp.]TJU74344.1 MAG: thiolase [Mesorhizobium sp.]
MTSSAGGVFIAGVAEAPLGKVADQTELSMIALACREALDEAGMTLRDVDGLFVSVSGRQPVAEVAEYLGIEPSYVDSTDIGGGSFEAYVHHAFAAVRAGRCEVALIAYASRQRSLRSRSANVGRDRSLSGQFEAPYGLPRPIGNYALIAARHMHQYGTTAEQMADVAVAARAWAATNPKAWARTPLTRGQVMDSPYVAEPLHALDCCLVTDGGGAVVVTTAARGRDARKSAVRVLGMGEKVTHWMVSQIPDPTITPGVESGRQAYGMAGVAPDDMDLVLLYDNFTIAVIMQLEDLGFCRKGEGGAFASPERIGPGGTLPVNPMGGGLSYNHPGMLGLLLIVEAVRQLRGEAGLRQVTEPELAVVHGIGGACFGSAATLVLGSN